jgi:ABC-type transport system involved in Fe-S cluster assembly fused permease/ATPase subunit
MTPELFLLLSVLQQRYLLLFALVVFLCVIVYLTLLAYHQWRANKTRHHHVLPTPPSNAQNEYLVKQWDEIVQAQSGLNRAIGNYESILRGLDGDEMRRARMRDEAEAQRRRA